MWAQVFGSLVNMVISVCSEFPFWTSSSRPLYAIYGTSIRVLFWWRVVKHGPGRAFSEELLGCGLGWFRSCQAAHGFRELRIHLVGDDHYV
jgi:hypothetical protein